MGRHRQPEIRLRLLDACTDHALRHGLPDRRTAVAAAAGTSERMLIYHFGTRDGLLREVLHRARQRQRDLFGDLVRLRDDEPYPMTLRRAWAEMSGERGRPFLRMFGRLREDTEQQLWPGFRRIATTDWLDLFEEGMRSLDRPGYGTLALAVVRGLILDLEATGDVDRADRAFEQFVTALDGGGALGAPRSEGDATAPSHRWTGPGR